MQIFVKTVKWSRRRRKQSLGRLDSKGLHLVIRLRGGVKYSYEPRLGMIAEKVHVQRRLTALAEQMPLSRP
jgi:hypothetical protein